MSNVQCLYCGHQSDNNLALTNQHCYKNTDGKFHVQYEGREKSKYECKYCGHESESIYSLTLQTCYKNPDGKNHRPR